MTETLGYTFDGQSMTARPGQSLAAALTEGGRRTFRHTATGGSRGMFCGIGVCQDCLVTVDGVPNRRACMTLAEPGQLVQTQVALAPLSDAVPPSAPARSIAPDVLVIGGGAAGLNAAISAAGAGARVIVLDERKVPGGQYFKQPAGKVALLDEQQAEGAALVTRAQASGAEIIGGVEIWGAFEGPLILAAHEGGALVARPGRVIVATGAYERPVMVPGWTLPGVMTTGAAQTLWRSYRTLPGRRVAVCGSGPLNLQVASELARGGAEVVLVAEAAAAPWRRPADAMALMLAGPALAAKGVRFMLDLRSRGIPVRHRTSLLQVEPHADGLRATFSDGGGRTFTVQVDTLCMNGGFEPQNEILRLLGAAMTHDDVFGHLRCTRDDAMQTSVPGIYAAGDCAGLGGAPAAAIEGRIAGLAAAGAPRPAALYAELARHRRFQARLWAMHAPGPRPVEALPDDTIICRCEEITLGQVRAAMAEPHGHAATLKRATRLGMGRCQGRYCAGVAARLVAGANGQAVTDHSNFAPRVPIKPVAIASILAAQEALDGPA